MTPDYIAATERRMELAATHTLTSLREFPRNRRTRKRQKREEKTTHTTKRNRRFKVREHTVGEDEEKKTSTVTESSNK